MKASTFIKLLFVLPLFVLTLSGCSSSSNSPPVTNIYSTTSTRGDYSEWTITAGQLNATWEVINVTGQIDHTFTLIATCGAADAAGIRACTITTSSCADGVTVCPTPPTGDVDIMDVPGVALFALTDDGGVDRQLHVGFVKNASACTDDVSGDYSFIRTGLGLSENFGMYRSDSNFVNILHSDFGFNTVDANATQTVAYRTGSEAETLTDNGCTDGVRDRGIGGGEDIRSMMTASGLFVLDFPAGQGGLISFKTSNAATLADFAGNNFGGISFPDNGPAETFSATFGSVFASKIDINVVFAGGTNQTRSLMDLGTADSMTNPAYPSFTVSPTLPSMYSASTLSSTYNTPDDIPGLFKLGQLDDNGRVIMLAMKFNEKVIAVGMVYNYRTTTDVDPSAGDGVTTFAANNLYNTGNFLLFEK